MRVRQQAGPVLINIRPVLLVNSGLSCHCLLVSQAVTHHHYGYRRSLRYTLRHLLRLKMPENKNMSIKSNFSFCYFASPELVVEGVDVIRLLALGLQAGLKTGGGS